MSNWSPAEFISHVSRSVALLCAFLITRQLPSSVAEIMDKAKRNILGSTKVNVFADESIALKEVRPFGRAYDVSDSVYDRVKSLIFSEDRQSHLIAHLKEGTDNSLSREHQFGLYDGQNGAIFIVKLLIYCQKKQRASSTFCIAGLYMNSTFESFKPSIPEQEDLTDECQASKSTNEEQFQYTSTLLSLFWKISNNLSRPNIKLLCCC